MENLKNLLLLVLSILLIQCSTNEKNSSENSNPSPDQITFKEIRPVNKTISPAISKLLKSEPESRSYELDKLWTTIQNEGSPLTEKDPLYNDYVYLTFIYRDDSQNKEINFEVFGIYDEYRWGNMKMYRFMGTDLYYRCYMIPNDLCFSYRFILNDTITGERQIVSDPLNTNLSPTGERNKYSWSVLDLRTNEPDWYTKRFDNVGSKLDTFQLTSNILNNTRDIYAYLPPDYNKAEKKYPVIYLFDSFIYLHRVEVPNTLDNLIKEGKIEPIVAVMLDNPTSTSRKSELPLNLIFKQFIIEELVPHIKNKYNITDKPEETIIGGISYGGLASTYIAFYHPDIFGNVLSQSGSFWRDLEWYDTQGDEIRGDWLINQFLTGDRKDLKIYLDWGLQENWCLSSGRKMAKVLNQKDYKFKFVEFNGWHDWSNSRKTFPEALMYLLENE